MTLPPTRRPTPQILTVGVPDARCADLRAFGCTVRTVTSLLHAYAETMQRRTPPTLLLLDLATADRALTAPQLIAVLARRIGLGAIDPLWLIGLARADDPELDQEAALAGCHLVLHLPWSADVPRGLARLARTPALVLPLDRAALAYQRDAAHGWAAIETGPYAEGVP